MCGEWEGRKREGRRGKEEARSERNGVEGKLKLLD